jgi:hypothetical protein
MYSTEFLTRYAKDRMDELTREAAAARLRPRERSRTTQTLAQRQNADLASTMTLPRRPARKAL